jgi:pimeloyl-ACP methyl ester carboxylesterase
MRGYGLTDAPATVEDYAMEHLVEDVSGIVKAFGRDRAHIAGHDWGAIVAWFFAARHPEMTSSLTALSVGHPAATLAAARDQDQRERSRYISLFLIEGKAEEVLSGDGYRRLRETFGGEVGATANHFIRSLSRPGRLTAGLNYYRANMRDIRRWAALANELRVDAPTVLLWGDNDPYLGRAQADLTAERVSGEYRLEILEGAGHWLQFERPGEVSRSLVGWVQ